MSALFELSMLAETPAQYAKINAWIKRHVSVVAASECIPEEYFSLKMMDDVERRLRAVLAKELLVTFEKQAFLAYGTTQVTGRIIVVNE